jgi:hypothetical protein
LSTGKCDHAQHNFKEGDYWKRMQASSRGLREPSLIVLLAYSKLAQVSVDELIDDKIKIILP